MISKEKSRNVFIYAWFIVLSFVIVLFCSENSFLYPFNTEVDVNCFYTVARCIKRGDVLYRDIYEHKGLYLYYIYMLAGTIVPNSYHGLYIIQALFASMYMCITYKSMELISNNRNVNIAVAIFTIVLTYTCNNYREGGYAEEMVIPLVAAVIYLAIKYFLAFYPDIIPSIYVITIGIILAIMFWIKYTVVGVVCGLAVYIMYKLIRDKRYKMIFIYMLELVLGFVVGSIPAIIYFVKNNAVSDLLHVYFYNLLFVYDGYAVVKYNTIEKILCAFDITWKAAPIFLNSAIMGIYVCVCLLNKPVIDDKNVDDCVRTMFIVSSISVAAGVLFNKAYQALILCPFYMFSIFYIIRSVNKIKKESIDNIAKYIINVFKDSYMITAAVACATVIVMYAFKLVKDPYVIILMVAYSFVIYKLGNGFITLVEGKIKVKPAMLKYALLIVVFAIAYILGIRLKSETSTIECSCILVAIMYLCEDWIRFSEQIVNWINGKKVIMVNVSKKVGIVPMISCAAIICSIALANNIGYALWTYEMTPQYFICKYIENSKIEDPIIYHYYTLDSGVFNLMDTYPQMKYYGHYNIMLPEIEETMQHYVKEANADFIITTDPYVDNDIYDNYSLVYIGEPYMNANESCFCLFRKIKTSKDIQPGADF